LLPIRVLHIGDFRTCKRGNGAGTKASRRDVKRGALTLSAKLPQ
jgi:hypothetical protein